MKIETYEEFSTRLQEIIGDRTDDTALRFIEDARDTFNKGTNDNENWEEKYKQNDAEWRQRYKDAFFSAPDPAFKDNLPDNDEPKKLTYESLFKGV